MRKFVKLYWEYILAFIIPIIIVVIHCIVRDSWLFGNGSILRGDAGVQYVYLFEELWNKVHNGDFSFYSWNALGGFDIYLNLLYYAVSPATLIILILPKACLYDAIQFFMVLKWALMCFTSVYFFMHTRFNSLEKQKKLAALVLGLCYAMSNFFLNVLQYFNWLDSFIIFPILLLLVEKMMESGKWKIYYLLLTVSMICNFYISFSACIFLLFWFVLQVMSKEQKNRRIWKTFIGSSVLAAATAGMVILPCVMNVNRRSTLESIDTVKSYITSILYEPYEFIRKFFIFHPISDHSTPYTSFYASVGVIALCLLYGFIKMNKKIKYSKMGMTIFMLVCFFVGGLDYVWHGFSIPNVTDHRYAYLFIMLLLLIALDVLSNVEQVKIWQCTAAMCISLAIFVYTFFKITEYDSFIVYLGTILLIVLYFILFVLLCKNSIQKSSFIKAFFSICLLEIVMNSFYQWGYYDQIKPSEDECITQACNLAEQVKLEDGERYAIVDAGHNPGLRASVPCMTGFVSYANGELSRLSEMLGMHTYQSAGFLYNGGTPVLNLMFNIRYGIGANAASFSDCEQIMEDETVALYQMKRIAGLGYMTDNSIENWETENGSTFDLQNAFIQYATGDMDCKIFKPVHPADITCSSSMGSVEPLDFQDEMYKDAYIYNYTPMFNPDGITMEFTVERNEDLYLALSENTSNYVRVLIDSELVYQSLTKARQNLIHIGNVKKGDKISVICAVEGMVNTEMQVIARFAEFDDTIYQEKYELLSSDLFKINKMSSDRISGEIQALHEGVMMTSIQAVDGFEVYVDQEKKDYKVIGKTFIGVPLDKGEHTVEFVYHTPYAEVGWFVSIIAFMIYIAICIRDKWVK